MATKLIPNMTSKALPSPYAAWGNSGDAWKAFDGSVSSFCYMPSGSSNYILIDMGEPVGISGYTYTPYSGWCEANKWTFKASNDWNGTWDTLDTQSGLTTSNGVEQTFNVSPTKKYRYYKWDGVQYNSGNDVFAAEFNLLDTAEPLDEDDLHLGDKLIPQLTANNSASPIIVSGSDNGGGQAPWNAFDNSLSSFYFAGSGANNYLKMDLGEAKRIAGYTYVPISGNDNQIKNWTLLGSNDDTDWDEIDSVVNFGSYIYGHEFVFVADSLQAYRYYKLYPMNNGGSYALVADFNLLEYVEGVPPATATRRFAQII